MKRSGAERLKDAIQKKKEHQRQRHKRYYEKNKNDISQRRKEARSTIRENGPFPYRMAAKRQFDNVNLALPTTPEKKAHIIAKIIETSPNTKQILQDSGLVTSPEVQKEVQLGKAVLEDVRNALNNIKECRSDDKRAAINVGISMVAGEAIIKNKLKSSLAQVLNINRRRIGMCISRREEALSSTNYLWTSTERKTRSDAISEEDRKIAHDFWASPVASRHTGNKRDVIRKRVGPKEYISHSKQILEQTQTEIYFAFRNTYPQIKLGQRMFENCKPYYVIPPRQQNRNSCCCRLHVEMRMLFQSCMSNRKLMLSKTDPGNLAEYPVFTSLNDLVQETLCPKNDEEENYFSLLCLNRQCDKCGVKNLKLLPEEESTDETVKVKWQTFEYVNVRDGCRRLQIVCKETPVGHMYAKFKELLKNFPQHQFRANWQHQQLKTLSQNIPLNDVLCIHDYSENYSCQHQDQIQSMYFSQTQASIHVTILKRHALEEVDGLNSTEENTKMVTEHIFVISPDKNHDHHSVHECRIRIAGYLKDIGYNVSTMHEWTDGCSAQYKSRHCMGDLTYSNVDFGFKVIRNYFETSHAKGPQDGAGANLKHKADMSVIKRQVVIQNAKDLYDFASTELHSPAPSRFASESVSLSRRIFFYVEENSIRASRRFTEVKGNRSIHAVKSGEAPCELLIRKLSCYCDGCLYAFGQCSNTAYVHQWDTIKINHEVQPTRRQTRAMDIHEETTDSIKDLVTQNCAVAIASGDSGDDYYLLKITSEGPEKLSKQTKDDWGLTFPTGAEVFKGHFYIRKFNENLLYELDENKVAIVYSESVTYICDMFDRVHEEPDKLLYMVQEEQHRNILDSLDI